MAKIDRAVLSCHDKTGLVDLAKVLQQFGVELICTGGTLRELEAAGVTATRIGTFTGVGEMLDGRVKSLHPRIHAGLLGSRDNKVHAEQMASYGFPWLDFVCVNFHPIESITCKPGITIDEVLEQVDIGGVAMVRSAAKNFRYVTVVVNPARYKAVIHELYEHGGELSFATRYRLAQEAFDAVACYDKFVSEYLRRCEPPKE